MIESNIWIHNIGKRKGYSMRKAVAVIGFVVSAVLLLLGMTVNVPNDYLE